MTYIADMKADDKVKGYYLCKYKQMLKNKNGKEYCTLRLQDKSGTVEAKIWSIHTGIESFDADDVVMVEGDVILYQENLQLNVNKLEIAKEGEYNLKDLLPHTTQDVNQLEKDLFNFVNQVSNPFIKKLLEEIFYQEEIYKAFMIHGAAKTVHHAYLSGLLEHSIQVTKLGVYMAQMYEGVNKDLVIAGCLLHDLGKLYELSPFPQNDYTDEGQLIGHLVIGAEKVHDLAKTIPDFPEEIERLIKHIILSHHGEYEYGSPKRPKCMEAMVVHLADNADAKMKMLHETIQSASEESGFVGYHKLLNRNIRKVNL